MTLKRMAVHGAFAVGMAVAGVGIAGTAAAGASTARPVSSQDRMFMNQASQINLTEIALGRYVKVHATTTAVKNLGGSYAHDHSAAQARLASLALRLRVTLPTAPGRPHQSMVTRIEAQTGRKLDVAFAKASVSGHRAAIAIFRTEENAGSNPAVKAYASHYLPMLRTHLKWAEHAESAMGVTSPR